MRDPDEIKKGLECCFTRGIGCDYCPYVDDDGVVCVNSNLGEDALAYIQQLEAERDAAVNDLSNCDGNCHYCDWFGDTGCVAPDDGIRPKHTHDCPFKWRGVKEDNP